MSYWCFHDRHRKFTFKDGVSIELCAECTLFDEHRIIALRSSNIDVPKAKQETHWNLLLDKAGVSMTAGDHPWLVYAGEVLSDKAVHKATHSHGEFEPVSELGDVLVILANMTRRYPIEYTMLDDNQHDMNAKPFPHTMNMPRLLKNFCPKCHEYEPADHECQGEMLNQQAKRREQEAARQLRDSAIKLSDPTQLTPSSILKSKGGYGRR